MFHFLKRFLAARAQLMALQDLCKQLVMSQRVLDKPLSTITVDALNTRTAAIAAIENNLVGNGVIPASVENK